MLLIVFVVQDQVQDALIQPYLGKNWLPGLLLNLAMLLKTKAPMVSPKLV